MAVLQSVYTDTVDKGFPGMIANTELANIISRTVESTTAQFGALALRGANDHGCITATAETLAAAAPVANAGNTGNGVFAATPAIGAGAMVGTYSVTIEDPVTNAGRFIVEDPAGDIIGAGNVGSAFSRAGVTFTLNDGATDFVAGDSFTFAVDATGGTDVGTQLGIFRADTTVGAEIVNYRLGDTASIVTSGTVWVTAGASVAPGDPVYFVPSTGRYTNAAAAGAILVHEAEFDDTGVSTNLVRISLGNRHAA